MGRNSIVEFSRHGTARRGAMAARVCVRTRPFRIIIIHKLIDAADNIADVSRISIRLRENDESRAAETIQRHFLRLLLSAYLLSVIKLYIARSFTILISWQINKKLTNDNSCFKSSIR